MSEYFFSISETEKITTKGGSFVSEKNGLSYEQRKAMYEQNIRDTDGKRHVDKLRDVPQVNNGSKKKVPSARHRAQRIELKPPKSEPVEHESVQSRHEKRGSGSMTENLYGIFRRKYPKVKIVPPYMECVKYKMRGKFDMPLFTATLILLVMGIIMMSSASYAYALKEEGNSFAYAERQLVAAVIGFIAMIVCSSFDYHLLVRPIKTFFRTDKKKPENGKGMNIAILFFLFCVVLMIAVLLVGDAVNDAKRWITIGGIQFQPSELLKIGMIILLAYMLQNSYEYRNRLWYGFGKQAFIAFFAAALCMAQRHVSAMLIILAIAFVMMFVGGSNKGGLIVLVLVAVIGFIALVYVFKWEYLTDRITSWLHPFSDAGDTTYQTSQSLITIGSGGWFGLGLGNSRQKYYYLPESQNDFVFSIICEELGFFGGMTVILLFVLFEVRGFIIAGRAKDKFGSLMALGITLQIGLQAILNIAVACNAIPNTGISLPFFSYGRTALITQLAEVGLLLNISRDADT